jgi:hypothetical protein
MMGRPQGKANQRSQFTLKNIFLNGLLISVLFFLNKLSVPGSALCYGILFCMAIRSLEGAVKAMSISSIIIVANTHLVDINVVHTLLRFPLIAVAGARIFWEASRSRGGLFAGPHIKALLVFAAVTLVLAGINQYYFMISFLKLGVFIYGTYAIMLATDMGRFSGSDLTGWFCSLVLFYVAGNLLAYGLGVGYVIRETIYETGANLTLGLSGMTNHPQTQGPLSAISFVYAFCVYLFTPYRARWVMGVVAPVLLVLCYMSAARTGLFAALIAVGLVVGLAFMMRSGRTRVRMNISTAQIVSIGLLAVVGLIVVEAATGAAITQKVSDFALKSIRSGDGGTMSFYAVFESRMPLIESSWRIFLQRPWTGIGFGTSIDPQFVANATLFSAPTEKGFLPTALLEEVGIIGALLFAVFLIAFFVHYWKIRNIIALGMMACLLLLNLGEMMFFALGGMGLYSWSLIGAGIALGDRVVERS